MSQLKPPSRPSFGEVEGPACQKDGLGKPLMPLQELEATGPRDLGGHGQAASGEVSPLSGQFRNSLISYGNMSELSR